MTWDPQGSACAARPVRARRPAAAPAQAPPPGYPPPRADAATRGQMPPPGYAPPPPGLRAATADRLQGPWASRRRRRTADVAAAAGLPARA